MDHRLTINLKQDDPAFGVSNCGHVHPHKLCSQCTTCFVCGQSRGERGINYDFTNTANDQGSKFWYHQACLDALSCTRLTVFENNEWYSILMINSVSCECCYKCRRMIPNYPTNCVGVGVYAEQTCKTVYFHETCRPREKCLTCGWNVNPQGKSMIMVGPYMYHSGDCIPEPCMFCHEKVLSDPITIPVEGYDRSNLVHAKCLDKQVCQRCGHHGSFLLVREREIGTLNETHKDFDLCHARLDCHSDICSFCDEGIADFPWIPKNSIKFHSACVSELRCYVCMTLLGQKITIGDDRGFRHQACDPKICGDCNQIIAKNPSRTVNEIIYHSYCGPRCIACNGRDGKIYRITECGNFRHPDCSDLRCFVCLTYLGRPRDWLEMPIEIIDSPHGEVYKVHKECCFECPKCDGKSPNIKCIRKDDHIQSKNLQFVPPLVKANLKALWMLARRHRVPKDVCKLLPLFAVNCYTGSHHDNGFTVINSLPIRRNFDVRKFCTRKRCEEDTCQSCDGMIAWSKRDDTRCRPDRCRLIVTGYMKILTKVFGQDDRFFLPGENEGSVEVSRLMIEKGDKLSEGQLSLYHGINGCILSLQATRKINEEPSFEINEDSSE